MEAFQQRVIDERNELIVKLDRLRKFIGTTTFCSLEASEQGRMKAQANAMSVYARILDERIAEFK